jgi:hypothetical protein
VLIPDTAPVNTKMRLTPAPMIRPEEIVLNAEREQ